MIAIGVVGVLGACNVCYPVFLVMWLIACLILVVVIIVQMILTAVLTCTAPAGSVATVACNDHYGVTWAALGVTLGLAVFGFIFGVILFKAIRDEDEGGTAVGGGGGSSGGGGKKNNDYDY